jgi:hypothetical protein
MEYDTHSLYVAPLEVLSMKAGTYNLLQPKFWAKDDTDTVALQ